MMIFSKYYNNPRAFTLIEMMIVLMIISILLLIAIPNMTKNNELAQMKGCEATIDLLQAQVGAYQIENKSLPETLEVLIVDNYVDRVDCPNGTKLILDEEGLVRENNEIASIDDASTTP